MLSEREMRILAFERSWWRQPGAKEREILEVFGIPSTRYYQLLNELIDRPEAMEFDPALVTRLRRDDRFKAMRLAICSGSDAAEDRARSLEAGADAYLEKPLDPAGIILNLEL